MEAARLKELDNDPDYNELLNATIGSSWDHDARCLASEDEKEAARIIHKIREFERRSTNGPFGDNPSEALPPPEVRDMGGPFLLNKDRIDKESKLFDIARKLPKGALLHLHLNSQLEPEKLINRVAEEGIDAALHIATSHQLLDDEDFRDCEIQVAVRPKQDYKVDIFSVEYTPFAGTSVKEDTMWMSWKHFTEKFKETEYANCNRGDKAPLTAEEWVLRKIVLNKDDVYDTRKSLNW